MYKTIIWATDGSERAERALDEALPLSDMAGARIVAVHADQRLYGRAGAWPLLADEDELRVAIRRKVAALKGEGIDIELVVRSGHQDAAHIVAAVAKELDSDLIVCGTRGLGALSGAMLGSFTKRILHLAPCPVLAVPEPRSVTKRPQTEKVQVGA